MAVVTAAADVGAVAADASGHAVLTGAFQHGVIDPVHGHNARTAAAVEGEGGGLVFDAAEIRLRYQGAGHILPQIDAKA